jgi:hypothetical protein
MIVCEPNFFSKGYRLKFEDGQVGSMTIQLLTDRVHFHFPAVVYEAAKESVLSNRWRLTLDGATIATASKPNPLVRTFEIASEQGDISIRSRSLFFCKFDLFMGGEKIGSIDQPNIFTKRALLTGPSTVPDVLQVFAFSLVALTWRQARR